MKNVIRGVGAAAALLAAVASNAWAFGPFTNTEVCGGTLFTTCATLTTTYTGGVLTIEVANTSDNGDVFTAIGVRDITASGNTIDAALASDWQFTASNNQLGGDPDGANPKYVGFNTTNGVNGAIGNDGNTYVFTLNIGEGVDISGLELAFHSQSGPNQCSTKLFIDGTDAEVNTVDPSCASTTTVPEPITMSLLATGLAGMGGAGLIRRRNKKA